MDWCLGTGAFSKDKFAKMRASAEKAFIERAKSGAIDQVGEVQILKHVLAHVARFGDQTEQLRDVIDLFVAVHHMYPQKKDSTSMSAKDMLRIHSKV